MKSVEFLSQRLVVIIALFALTLSALADQTWKGTSDNQWTTTANWSGSAIPTSTDNVIYNATSTGNLSNWLSQAFSIKGILFTNPAGPVSINSASTLTNGASGIGMTNATQLLTISAPVYLGANQSWVVATNQTLLVPGIVSGSSSAGLYKDGGGTLYLNGANTFTGGFTNNGGAVWINNSAGLGGGSSTRNIWIANNALGAGLHLNGTNGNITLPNVVQFNLSQQYGAIINEVGDNVINGNMYVQSGGGITYVLANAGSLTLNGTIGLSVSARAFQVGGAAKGIINGAVTQSLPLIKTDSGTWTLNSRNNTYNGVTTIQGGTLALGANAAISNTPSITLLSNAVFDVSAVTNAAGTTVFTLSPGTNAQTLGGFGTVTGNVVTVAGTILQPGTNLVAGTLILTNNLTLSSGTTNYFWLNTATTPGGNINSLLAVGGNLDPQNARIFVSPQTPLTVGSAYVLLSYVGSKLSSFNSAVLTDSHYSFTEDESVANQIRVTAVAPPNLIWAGTVSSSAWDYNTTANWNSDTSKFLVGDPVVFDDTAITNTVTVTGTLRPSSVTFSNSVLNYLLQGSGLITGATGLTNAGSGTLTITTSGSTYTGPVAINGGVVSVNSVGLNGAASTLGAGSTIVLNGGTFQSTAANVTAAAFNRSFVLGANGGTISVGANGYLFITNTISGSGSLTKLGTTKQLIVGSASPYAAGVNTYTGNTYINQYELQIRNAYALGYGKAVVANGADLAVGGSGSYGTVTNNIDLNGGDGGSSAGTLQVNDASTSVTFGGTINLLADSSVGTVNNGNAVTFNISGPIIGTGGLKKLGTNTVTLTSANNTYSGTTTISAGRLTLGSSANINNSSSISVAAGAIFDVSAISSYSLASGQSVSASGNATNATIKGASGGTVSFGSQPITLTYDGAHPALTISQGTLSLNGNAFAVNTTNGSALAVGTYTIIQQATGNVSGSGSYSVAGTAIASGYTGSISVSSGNVSLIVKATPAFSNLTANQSVIYGTISVTLSGKVSAAGPVYPANGETITVTINGSGQTTTINDATGDFSINFNPSTIPYSAAAFPITYSYAGDASLNSAGDSSKTLTVNLRALDITANNVTKECSQSLTFAGTEFTTGAGQLVNGNTVASVTLTSSGAGSGAPTGLYDILPSAAVGSGLANYSITYHNGTLTVADTTPPAIVYYFTNLTLSATSTNCQALLPDLTGTNYIIAVDTCSSSVTVTQNPPANSWLPLGTNQVVLTALDSSGNATNSTNAVIVVDTTPPAITCPANISVVTTDPAGANVSFTVTALDACDPNPTVITSPASGSFFPAGTNTVNACAYDSSGNTNTCSFLVMVDRAPVVHAGVSAASPENQLLTLDLVKLLAVVSDPDNDPLSVAAAGPTSANGGTVTLTSTTVTYQPAANFVGADLFSYTISDGRGGLATNTVAVTVSSSNSLSPNVVYGPLISNGLFIVRFAGIPGYTYTVEATDDLGSPAWTKKTNLTAPVTDQGLGVGIFEFSESVGAATSSFYRTVYPSY